jgi:hypothetical protein
MNELNRLIRHGVAPLTAWLVAKGYLPEYMEGDVTEFAVIIVAIAIPYVVSWWRDKMKAS